MTLRAWGQTVADILRVLEECGPMSCAELCAHMNIDRRDGSAVVTRMAKATAKRPKRIHVVNYAYDMEGQRRYPRAVYAVGDAPDACRPKSDPRETKRRYNAKVRGLHTANFVFNLGLPRRVYENRKPA